MMTYTVTLKTGVSHEVRGYLECRQMASLIFTDDRGDITRAFAPDTWLEVTLNDP